LTEGSSFSSTGTATSVSPATVIREAIDRSIPAGEERRMKAGRLILDAPDIPLPDPAALRKELEEIRSGR